jgi:RNA polymerase sigma-70 factor (ECF subfamily)
MVQMVNNREDAHDLTQEAFGKAFHKLPTYAPKFAFSTWLFKIAKNNCIDHIRKKRLITFSIDDPIEADSANDYSNNIQAEILDPEEEVIRAQKLEMVQDMVNGLTTKYKSMIQLRYYEEKTYDEIATELKIPLGTVKAQLFRAKELLFLQMQQPGPSAYLDSTKRWKKRNTSSKNKKASKKLNKMSKPALCLA